MTLVNAQAKPSQKRYELKSIPDGWVEVRRLDHGEVADRMGKVIVVGVGNPDKREDSTRDAHIDHRAQRAHDFAKAIVDHNLGTKDGRKFNFSNPHDVWSLDPTIADEVNDIIGEHQEAIPDEELPN